jgi:hypothetical protein
MKAEKERADALAAELARLLAQQPASHDAGKEKANH